MRKTIVISLAVVVGALNFGSLASATQAYPQGRVTADGTTTADRVHSTIQIVQYRPDPNGRLRQFRGSPNRDAFRDRRYWDRQRGNGYYDRTYGRERRDNSSALAAGFLGFVLGAAIAGSAADRDHATGRLNDQSWTAGCMRRYRSFDLHSGTYLGNDGYRHYCR